MNLIFSYSADDDHRLFQDGHTFLGAGDNENGSEVHVWLKSGEKLAVNNKQIQYVEACLE